MAINALRRGDPDFPRLGPRPGSEPPQPELRRAPNNGPVASAAREPYRAPDYWCEGLFCGRRGAERDYRGRQYLRHPRRLAA